MAIRFNEQRYRHVFDSPVGPVGRHLARTGIKCEAAARAIVTEEKLVRTGRYRQSIASEVIRDAAGLVLRFGSANPIARLLERGSPPHVIAASTKRALWWDMPNDRGWAVQPDDGRPVPKVFHPGNRPYNVLHRAVRRVLIGGF